MNRENGKNFFEQHFKWKETCDTQHDDDDDGKISQKMKRFLRHTLAVLVCWCVSSVCRLPSCSLVAVPCDDCFCARNASSLVL